MITRILQAASLLLVLCSAQKTDADDYATRLEVAKAIQAEIAAEKMVSEQEAVLEKLMAEVAQQEANVARAEAAREKATAERNAALSSYMQWLKDLGQAPTPSLPPAGGDELQAYLDTLPFAEKMPRVPQYEKPTREDCHWILEAGFARSTRGLPDVPFRDGAVSGDAYRASIAAGHELPITFGVVGDGGRFVGGGLDYHNKSWSITSMQNGRWADVSFRIVGLSPDAECGLGWNKNWGAVDSVEAHDIGIRGPNDSFIIRANDGVNRAILDGCWWLTRRGVPMDQVAHASGLHVDRWGLLVVRNHKWRGKNPGEPGALLREHSLYLKSSKGQTWIVDSDLKGGNRTGFQIRPGADTPGTDPPEGPVVVARNTTDGYGWEHGSHGGSFAGGSFISVWSSPFAPVFVVGNRITDAKYGCLMVGGQGWSETHYLAPNGTVLGGDRMRLGIPQDRWINRNWYNSQGRPLQEVYVADNVFENTQKGRAGNFPKRDAVSLNSATRLFLYGNDVEGGLTLGSQWSAEHALDPQRQLGNQGNLAVLFADRDALDLEIKTYEDGVKRPITQDEKESMFVDVR